MTAYAHTPNHAGQWHDLVAHLRAVADHPARFAEPFGAAEVARHLGLWHDLGKFDPAFQEYLHRCKADPTAKGSGPDHKAAGSRVCLEHRVQTLALLIQGHHGGLKSPTDFQKWFGKSGSDPAVDAALRLARPSLPELDPHAPIQPPARANDALAAEFFMRMLFSALVDADHLDTEAHFQADKAALRGAAVDLSELWDHFEQKRRTIVSRGEGAVGEVRREVYEACLAAAAQPPGLFRLTVPTGGGKTLSGMAFALRHALAHSLRRVVVAVPYISITEQTASVYRDAFSADSDEEESPVVLEHHSAAGRDGDDEGDFHRDRLWARLAAENWEAPVIVTTTVQLFESLFANRTSPTRKLHRLARSVVILDEAQALPSHLLAPALDALRQLCDHYGTTVVISTATQPAFDQIPQFRDLQAREIVPNHPCHFAALKRVGYEWRTDPKLSWEEVADVMREERQALAIVNTKKDALALLDALDAAAVMHLSTSLCGAHRRKVIEDVKGRLQRGEPCHLVSTQVIEAGVDLDFPLVLRALGPLDGIIQAAGRCNREGKLGPGGGRVIVFDPEEGGTPPGAYRLGVQSTRTLLGRGVPDPDDPDTYRDYYRGFVQLLNLDARDIQKLRRSLDYPEVARLFQMIEEDTVVVIVTTYGDERERAQVLRELEGLRHNPANARWVLRRLQPYTVAVRRRSADEYRRQGFISPILPDLEVGEWHGAYDPVRGLLARDADAEVLVV